MTTVNLEKLQYLEDLFSRLSKKGEHVNRISNAALWANLEQEQAAYEAIFNAIGFDLRIDSRGFAWFNTTESSTSSNQKTRVLALFFMVLFEFQGDSGKPLRRFMDWRIDNNLLNEVYEQHKEILSAEEITAENFTDLARTAERFGFMRKEEGAYYLLPAVYRYLDHFEALAANIDDDFDLDVGTETTIGEEVNSSSSILENQGEAS